jgi:hypothetical protein
MLTRTINAPTEAEHRQALQAFLEELSPWVTPADLPTLLGQPFTLLAACDFTPHDDGQDETVSVALSLEGAALFRAWLRRRGLDPFLSSS